VCTPDWSFYPILLALLVALIGPLHKTSLQAISALVWALLLGQSLRVSDLARGLRELRAQCARQGMRRVRRGLDRSPLMSGCLSPRLIRAVLRLVGDDQVVLVLDSTRCRRWEIFTLGGVYHGRVLPIAWSVLPYPWPKGQFTPTVVALLERTLVFWPSTRRVHLVADRGFPSLKLFGCLEAWRSRLPAGQLGYTIRLRAGDYVQPADGQSVRLADLLRLVPGGEGWTSMPASYFHRGHQSPTALLVLGHSLPVYPTHQRGPADAARRAARAKRRRAHLLSKAQPASPTTDGYWLLLSTCPTIAEARAVYEQRFRTEGMYRDLKEWNLEWVAAHETDRRHLDGLVGLAALGYFVQAALGAMAGCALSDRSAQACQRQLQWCTTDRLSVFWRGRQVLQDRAFDWRPWLKTSLESLAQALADPPVSHTAHPHLQDTPAQEPPNQAARSTSAPGRAKEAA
jgi:hypothetical protein